MIAIKLAALVLALLACSGPPAPDVGGGVIIEEPVAWNLERKPAPRDSTLSITLAGGGCFADQEQVGPIDVKEDAHLVTIAAHIRKPGSPPAARCPAIARFHRTEVELASPLGQRRVIDALTDQVKHP
jgi:hypothetical protein